MSNYNWGSSSYSSESDEYNDILSNNDGFNKCYFESSSIKLTYFLKSTVIIYSYDYKSIVSYWSVYNILFCKLFKLDSSIN